MKLNIIEKMESGIENDISTTENENTARRIATRESEARQGQIYIRWYRASDGQTGYLNRDGHSPVGKAW